MMVLLGTILIVLGLISLIGVAHSEKLIFAILFILLSVICILFGSYLCYANSEKSIKEYKYPASEYSLEYEITMRGEQIDTVYVLTRKQL